MAPPLPLAGQIHDGHSFVRDPFPSQSSLALACLRFLTIVQPLATGRHHSWVSQRSLPPHVQHAQADRLSRSRELKGQSREPFPSGSLYTRRSICTRYPHFLCL
ncbi:hypothetical protein AcW1_009479 [Taiwanofungus camphoratus]|nr:hypothetical protein AcV5_002616 [Antrodia cinnamomea]KAI0918800.1 hypothetical protein AcV7_006928 [Antrodia cinnamomea]KAI0947814.1 hypothetical protein AcW1_009479 [Antrodia cinnamomea]